MSDPYFCKECKRNHSKGKIYKEHLQYALYMVYQSLNSDGDEILLVPYEDDEVDVTITKEFKVNEYITIMKVFKVNEYLTLKLENDRTNIYVNGELINQCKYLMLNIPINETEKFDEIESIDEAADILGWRNEGQEGVKYAIDPDTEFWGHCSNLQAWYENKYDTRLLHSNLSFPLLKRLVDVGDPLARQVFKNEIRKRLISGFPSVIEFLEIEGYIGYLTYAKNGKYGKEAVKKLPGIGEASLRKLINAGFTNLKTIVCTPSRVIQEESGLRPKTTEKLKRVSMEELNIRPRKASEVWEERKKMIKLTTGSREFDDSLGGGIEAGSLTELFGVFRTGKTQLCHQLCVNVQLPYEQGGLNGSAYYIDTENSFRPERIMQMALSLHLNYKEILDNIFICRAYNSDHQSLLIKEVHDFIPKFNIKLLVLDNIINHFLEEYDKKGKLEILRNTLRRHLRDLQMLLDVYPSLIIIFVNQVKNNTDVTPIIPLGGNIIAHASTTRIYLRKGKGEQRLAKIVKSPYISENDLVVFSITENGIRD